MARHGRRRHTVACVVFLLSLAAVAAICRLDVGLAFESLDVSYRGPTAGPRNVDSVLDDESLRYIPPTVVRAWEASDFLIALGIPSVDMNARRRRRDLQRSTLWTFPGVATRANNFSGAMLVLYVFGRHPSHNFTYSLALQQEAAEWHDVIALPMNEGRPSTNKTIGGGKWGNEAEIGLSRKVFRWFDMA
ncbi:UDP-Gal or UDP-GlcNAc-dependent glycosyltransferase, partial [Trypanosoma grayi]|uniref:UDP-Gal or UDP-GlcNAc-dependent glycosyltransferase n=1 Tax=Trypanosoma grayi TaxID=71804 RepID=UPI0004F46C05